MIFKASKYKKWMVLGLLIGCFQLSFSQKVLESNSGQRILIAADGSWSILKGNENVSSSGQVQNNVSTSLDAFQAPNQGKYPLSAIEKSEVDRILHSLNSDEAQLLVNKEFHLTNLNDYKQKLKNFSGTSNGSSKKELKSKIKLLENSIAKIEKSYKSCSNLITDAKKLLAGKEKNRSKVIASLNEKSSMDQLSNGMGGTPYIASKSTSTSDSESEKALATKVTNQYPRSFENSEKNISRDEYDCEIVFDGFDENIGSKKKEVREEYFFGFSQERMKSYFKNDDYITCNASVSKVGKHYFLTTNIRIKSKEAKKTYGMLRANENIRLELIDGSKVYCVNIIQDNGTVEPYTGHTLYTGVFQIDKDDLDKLQNEYLDNIGIIWSSGYEQYNIFNVDFLRNQLRCLKK